MPANPPITNGLILWLDAETSVTKDSSNRVSRWTDALAGSLYADEIIDFAKPVWVADAFPGHAGVRFDGNDGLFIEAGSLGQGSFTLIALGRAGGQRTSGGSSPTTGQRLLFSHTANSAYPSVSVAANGVGIYQYSGGYSLRCEAVTDASVLCPLVIRYENNAPSVYLNGSLVCQAGAAGTQSLPHGLGGSFIGDIAEILIYDRALTEQERLSIETYLQAKYDCYGGSSDSSESSESSESSDSSSSESSESSESSDSSGSESSDSSGGGGGGSSEGSSDSSDSSSSESSESSESGESSSSSSMVSSSSSNGGPSLYFDEDPVYVDWNDTDYDASGNLVTNCDPITWTIDGQVTINDDGVVTFGSNGEETTVTASSNPYDSFTLNIAKLDLHRNLENITGTNNIEVFVGEKVQISAVIAPDLSGVANLTKTWTIEGNRIFLIDGGAQ